MNLLMISGDRMLAVGKHGAFYNTLQELHKHFDRIDVICPKITNSYQLTTNNYFGNVFLHPSPWPLILQPLWILRAGLRVLKPKTYKLEAKSYAMTVHEYAPFYNGLGAYLLWRAIRAPYILEIHHIPGFPRAADMKDALYRFLTRLFIAIDAKSARAVRVVNESQTAKFLTLAGVPESKIKYIPSLYIDSSVFRPMDVAKSYDCIFVGRLVTNKGLDLLLEALLALSTTYNLQPTTLIVGDGSLRHELELKAKSYKLKAEFHGFAKDSAEIAGLINQSRLLVMPSYNEGGPRVVAEAMACGVPVVATPVGVVPDMAGEKGAGLVADWSGKDIAEKMRQLLTDGALYAQCRENGLALAEQFERTASIKRYADAVKEILIPKS